VAWSHSKKRVLLMKFLTRKYLPSVAKGDVSSISFSEAMEGPREEDAYRLHYYLEDGPRGSKQLFGTLMPLATISAKKRGRIPVAWKWPSTEPFGPLPVRTNL
jgi:hypothetical protein